MHAHVYEARSVNKDGQTKTLSLLFPIMLVCRQGWPVQDIIIIVSYNVSVVVRFSV